MERAYKAKLIYDELDGFDALEKDRFYGSEDTFHFICKHLAAKIITDEGRDVCIEIDVDGGTIDVLDMGESTEPARAVELETAYSPQTAREKYEQYAEGSELIEDVHVIPIGDAPTDLDELEAYLRSEIPAV